MSSDLHSQAWSGSTEDVILREFIDRNQVVQCYEDTEIWLVSSDPFTGYPPPPPVDPTDPHPPQPPPYIPPPIPGLGTIAPWYEDVVLLIPQ